MTGIVQALLAGYGAVSAAASDAYFYLTTLLLPGNGTNGAQNNTFLDSSTNTFTITRNGNTTQGTFSPFSQTGWSNYFNSATPDYLTLSNNAAFDFGTSDVTIEAWVYITSFSNTVAVFSAFPASGTITGYTLFVNTSGFVAMDTWVSGTEQIITATNNALSLNTWNHIAYTRASGTSRLFVNGNSCTFSGSISQAINTGGNIEKIGYQGYAGFPLPFAGYISNVRVTKGGALYTAAFTPSTIPLTTTVSAGTVSLLTCQSNRFIDTGTANSGQPFSITVNGSPSVQAFSPFAPTAAYSAATVGGSGYFDGTGDSLASTTDFESATNISTFTVEGFVYPTTFSTLINVIGGMVVSSGDQKSIAAEVNTSGQVALYWFDGSIKRCTGNSVMQLNAWNYFAIVVSSNAISIYVNKTTADTLTGTTTLTNRNQLTDLGVGAYYNNGVSPQYFNGYLANLRYSTVARTISAVPTAPFTSDSDTRWLLNFTNAGITDATAKNDLETVGNAQISTTQSKFGGGSMYFDGTGDYLVTPSSPVNILGSGDFTVELWAYPSNTSSAYRALVGSENYNSTTGGWTIYQNGTAIEVWLTGGSSALINATSSLTATTWQHIALSRASGTVRLFVNGTSVGSASNSAEWTGQRIFIGDNNVSGTDYFYNGYIDDLRITKGYARYVEGTGANAGKMVFNGTNNLALPTTAFPLQ